jgi:hypothetical protein
VSTGSFIAKVVAVTTTLVVGYAVVSTASSGDPAATGPAPAPTTATVASAPTTAGPDAPAATAAEAEAVAAAEAEAAAYREQCMRAYVPATDDGSMAAWCRSYVWQMFYNPPAGTASGATAVCTDGSLSYSAHRQGTCSHHGGVSTWLR